ncbi:putative nucleic-acid-binding protein [Phyllobacterium myrsinacearum]|uniref:type II toxin-antitoxin system VapC family toxin n=1 Tax=Phyllobacterium myrsinacearum TaxID=28101 RepID=UPI00102917CB|nr:type II toxin-antitoxin system VapC family toxin [Phyllobacterium myrsinacearum]RZS88197.1 putative nucleic-acid-binding protein [Phyllobacterium myrsinacearum]
MKAALDTNVLLRAVVQDDPVQSATAANLLREVELVAVSTTSLCEFCWVLARGYKFDRSDIARAVRALIASENVVSAKAVVEAGLAVLDAGGDFADGVIAFDGQRLGGEVFVTFDKIAANIIEASGVPVKLLSV